MNDASFEFFLHGKNQPQVIAANAGETLKEVLTRLDALPGEGQFVFVGEAEDAVHNPDAEADGHEPANIDLSLEQLELRKLKHVHTRAVHRVQVTVHFNGAHHKRRFSPATTIATVTAWAKNRFHVDPSGGADLVLALLPSKEIPRADVHLGELLKPGTDTLEFDLVREITPQG